MHNTILVYIEWSATHKTMNEERCVHTGFPSCPASLTLVVAEKALFAESGGSKPKTSLRPFRLAFLCLYFLLSV